MITSDTRALAGPAGKASYGDDDLAPGATFLDVPDGRRGLAERVGLVDGGCDLPGLDEIPEDSQVSGILRIESLTMRRLGKAVGVEAMSSLQRT